MLESVAQKLFKGDSRDSTGETMVSFGYTVQPDGSLKISKPLRYTVSAIRLQLPFMCSKQFSADTQ